MTPADMRARADWLHTWYDEKTTPAMLRAGADAIEEVERLREEISARDKYAESLRKLIQSVAWPLPPIDLELQPYGDTATGAP